MMASDSQMQMMERDGAVIRQVIPAPAGMLALMVADDASKAWFIRVHALALVEEVIKGKVIQDFGPLNSSKDFGWELLAECSNYHGTGWSENELKTRASLLWPEARWAGEGM